MQHSVLKASGHVDRFNDFMVKDVKASGAQGGLGFSEVLYLISDVSVANF